MRRTRVIPSLLLQKRGFYKTTKFKKPVYLGDPINILKIFNDKEVDEICILDIGATTSDLEPQIEYLTDLASECFMPLAYGGGISKVSQMSEIFANGFEKCIVNTAFHTNPSLVQEAANEFGSQSVVVSIDAKKKVFGGYEVYSHAGSRKTGMTPGEAALRAQDLGAGEILLNSIDRDGTMSSYDLSLVESISKSVSIPVIACGGAGSIDDLNAGAQAGASAVAAGAFFVFTGPHRAVLINVPSGEQLDKVLP